MSRRLRGVAAQAAAVGGWFSGPSDDARARVARLEERWKEFEKLGVCRDAKYRYLHLQCTSWQTFKKTWQDDPEQALPLLEGIEAETDTVRRFVDTSPGANTVPQYVPPAATFQPLERGSLENASAGLHAGSKGFSGDYGAAFGETLQGTLRDVADIATETTASAASSVSSGLLSGIISAVKANPVGAVVAAGVTVAALKILPVLSAVPRRK